ncbi:FUSC family protein [Okibacterium fritillariae]|uniref:FUSC family protein n=1 Tax=Okibacterium fritillariae TaxID=123320 RepID=UPI0040558E5E
MSSAVPALPWWKTVFVFGPHAGSHRVAVRAGISVVVPLVTVWALGHVEWSLYAAFGSFAALYGRNVRYRHRFLMQLSAAVVLVGAVVLGVVVAGMPSHEWWIVGIGAAWATLVAVLSDVFRWNPPGPLFGVFALCAVASVPPGPDSLLIAFVVSSGAAVVSLLVGGAGSVIVRRARADERVAASARPADAPSNPVARRRTRLLPDGAQRLAHAARFGVAAALAGGLSTALGIGHPYWAMIAAVVPLVAVRLSHSALRATHRIVGTFLGLILAAILLSAQPSGLAAIALVVALQIAAELFVTRNYGFALLFVTPLALVMIDLAHPTDTATLIVDRLVETALGTVVALLVAAATWAIWGRRDRASTSRSRGPLPATPAA